MSRSIARKGFLAGIIITILFQGILWLLYGLEVFSPIILILGITTQCFAFGSMVLLVYKYDCLKIEVSKDPLTKIFNRQHFMTLLEKEIARAKRGKTNLAMVLFDIDDFKLINDNYGHYAGDQTLITLTQIISRMIRPYDSFGRLGGEEFAIILPEIQEQEALDLCERIRDKIQQARLNRKIAITLSIGVAMLEEFDDHHILYQKSDDAMYRAKNNGKNQVILYQ